MRAGSTEESDVNARTIIDAIVDGITSMGYEQSGLDTDYPQLVAHAAVAPKKLMIGVPSHTPRLP